MASGIKEVKNRMLSIESTRQITNAMQLVASSKLKKAKDNAMGYKEYFETVYETMRDLAESARNVNSIFLRKQEVERKLFIVIAGDRGLAGGYNSNVYKASQENIKPKDKICAIGKKSVDYYTRRGRTMVDSVTNIEKISFEDVEAMAELIINEYLEGEIEEVNIIYTEFISTLTQEVKVRRLLPLSHDMIERDDDVQTNWGKSNAQPAIQFLPSANAVLENLIPMYLTTVIYGAITQSFASEQGARRTAMESATDNAKEMISNLELIYNRARQTAVTQEIAEIVGGVEALK